MKILVVLSRFPFPIVKGDRLRAYYQIRGLAQHHEVHLLCLEGHAPSEAHVLHLKEFCASVTVLVDSKVSRAFKLVRGLFSQKPFQVHFFKSAAMEKAIRRLVQEKAIDLAYVQLVRIAENIPYDLPIHFFLDYMDAFSLGMENRIPLVPWYVKPFAKMEARRLRAYEAAIAARFHGMSIISEQDAAQLPQAVAEATHVIPNGVGAPFFEELEAPERRDIDLLFTGNMGYHPNVQSARFIVEKIVPELKVLGISPRICLAGVRPAAVVKAMASEDIVVTGFVEDLRTWFLRSKVYVAPLFSGQGLQNKLLESMAMGMPTLTTPLANAALQAEPESQIIICEDAKGFALRIKQLLEDEGLADALGRSGRTFVRENYHWDAMNEKLNRILEAVVTQPL